MTFEDPCTDSDITIGAALLPSLEITHIVWDNDLSIALDSSYVSSAAETGSFTCPTIEYTLVCYDGSAYVDCDIIGDSGYSASYDFLKMSSWFSIDSDTFQVQTPIPVATQTLSYRGTNYLRILANHQGMTTYGQLDFTVILIDYCYNAIDAAVSVPTDYFTPNSYS